MKLALHVAALATPLFVSAIGLNESNDVHLRGAGAVIASDAEGMEASFGVPEFLAQPEYCTKSCYRDCSCYSKNNDCYPKCCTKSKGNCPNGHMPSCDAPNEDRDPPRWDKSDPNACPGSSNGNDNDNDNDDNDNRDTRCSENRDCPSSQFCNLGDCGPNASGRCTDGGRDDNNCNRKLDRVCGCDQREYDNSCIAENYGVSVDFHGSCDDDRRTANDLDGTCSKNGDCRSGYYCKPLFGECSTNRRDGFCTRIPKNKDECKNVPNDSVCTCEGKTEKNECRAEYMEQGVRSHGECNSNSNDNNNSDDRDSRCQKTTDCPSSQYCKFAKGDCSPNSQGRCTDGGRGNNNCNRKLDRVCGCDAREYDNECEAENFGVTVDYTGTCRDSGRTQSDFDGTCSKNGDCRSGYYCKPLFGVCSLSKRDGFCVRFPEDRDDCEKYPHDKVCGCDHVTETNECRAEYERVGVDYRGSCNNEV